MEYSVEELFQCNIILTFRVPPNSRDPLLNAALIAAAGFLLDRILGECGRYVREANESRRTFCRSKSKAAYLSLAHLGCWTVE